MTGIHIAINMIDLKLKNMKIINWKEKIVIDIGSGNIKAYSINTVKEIKNIYLKNIMFKRNFSKEIGIAEEDKKRIN